jgi:uncharacterized membrane protein YesL
VAGDPPTVTGAPLPRAPTLGGALRAGAGDLFFNSWRAVPVNLVVGAVLILAFVAWANAGLLAGAAVSVLVAPPLAGLFRLGGQATRGLDVNLSDAIDPMRESPVAVLLAGVAFAVATLMLSVNVVTGLLVGGILPWMVSTAAAWGLLAMLVFGFSYWPIAVDPARAEMRPMARARLAALLAFAHPVRLGVLALVLALILAASTVMFAALLTVSVALCAFIACRYVLPAADRLEARMAAAETAAGATESRP